MVNEPFPTWRRVTTRVLQDLSWELLCFTSLSVIQKRGWRISASRLQMTQRGTRWLIQGLACLAGELGQGKKVADRHTIKFSMVKRPSSDPGKQNPEGTQASTTQLGNSSRETAPGGSVSWTSARRPPPVQSSLNYATNLWPCPVIWSYMATCVFSYAAFCSYICSHLGTRCSAVLDFCAETCLCARHFLFCNSLIKEPNKF